MTENSNELPQNSARNHELRGSQSASKDQQIAELSAQIKQTQKLFFASLLLIFLFFFAEIGLHIQQRQKRQLTLEFLATKQFCLVNKEGKVRATFGEEDGGKLALRLLDKRGEIRADFSLLADGTPILAQRDATSKVRSLLMVDEHGPHLSFFDSGGRRRLQLDTSDDSDMNGQFPGLRLFDSAGNTRLNLKLVTTADKSGESYSTLQFRDEKGRLRSSILLDKSGRPAMDFVDGQHKSFATFFVEQHNNRPYFYIAGPDGEVLWEARRR